MSVKASTPHTHHSSSAIENTISDPSCFEDISLLESELPSRPTSRLGFNNSKSHEALSTNSSFLVGGHVEVLYESEPRRRLYPTARRGGTELEMTSFMPQSDSGSPNALSIPAKVEKRWDGNSENNSFSKKSNADIDSNYTLYDSEEGTESASPFSLTDFDTSFCEAACEELEWSSCKHTSLPSPLSPRHIRRMSYHTPVRHRYRHHGHSRHSLHHLKWFWSSREERWMEHKAHIYDLGDCHVPAGHDALHPIKIPPSPPTLPMQHLPPLSVHPRRGDLRALRDPYCVYIDRYFVAMPIWTMSKTLWMFDIHMASASGAEYGGRDLGDESAGEPSDSESLETSGSHAFSDDSDSTLVESEFEEEISAADITGIDERQYKGKGRNYTDAEVDTSGQEIFYSSSGSAPTFTSTSLACPTSSHLRWATNWYRRWEILLQLCVDTNLAFARAHNPASPSKSRCFFIPDDSSQDSQEAPEEGDASTRNVLVVINGDDPAQCRSSF